MPTNRKVAFVNEFYYHIFNRGIDRKDVFTDKREFLRAIETLKYYRFSSLKIKLSRFLKLTEGDQQTHFNQITNQNKLIEIIAFCLMPNHFHFLIKQLQDCGISKFLANLQNSYTKYFNTKHERVGPLFQGLFKAVLVETDEQLIHLSRYIHLNPSSSAIVKIDQLENYPWSSLPEYLNSNSLISNTDEILGLFKNVKSYRDFVFDQALYAKELDKIKHLALE